MPSATPAHSDEPDLTLMINRVSDAVAGPDGAGDPASIEVLYDVVRVIVRRIRRPRAGPADPQTTDLLHHVWERVLLTGRPEGASTQEPRWPDREQFFAAVARTTMTCLVDAHRRRSAEKRGGGVLHVPVDEHRDVAVADLRRLDHPDKVDGPMLEALAVAIERLRAENERGATVVVLRFFCGLTLDEVALTLGVSEATVKRDWRAARIWLFEELRVQEDAGDQAHHRDETR